MSIMRQFMQAEFVNGYAQTILAALENEAKRKDQIRMLESHKRHLAPYVAHDTKTDSDGDDGS